MSHSITGFLIAAFFAIAMPANPLMAGPMLPSLAPGSQYQLIFVTSDTIDGTAGTEAPYNALVNFDAAPLNALLASAGIFGVSWRSITSTADGTDANVNAPWGGHPVFNTQASMVNHPQTIFNPSPSLYNGIQAPVLYDQNGVEKSSTFSDAATWTGSWDTGTGILYEDMGLGTTVDLRLGSSGPFGLALGTALYAQDWLNSYGASSDSEFSLFGLSSVITVPTPEPATATLLGAGIFLLAGMRLLRWRRRASE